MKRIPELDFLKGVLILLVICFHLVWFEQLHPDIKQVVYCFHMPGFLLISGYLMNVGKPPRQFLRTLLWLAVPYVVMESGYIYMASILPINEHIAQLTLWVYLKHLFLHPLGPYWYLHAIILCGAVYYWTLSISPLKGESPAVKEALPLREGLGGSERWAWLRVCLTAIAYYVLARVFGVLTFSSALYFLAGAMLRQSGMNFVAFFLPSRLSVIVFALLACFSDKPTQASLNGVLIAYFAISSLLSIYKYLPPAPRPLLLFFGRNSLMLYVFSPIFTVLCKQLVPYLKFDPTGLLFLVVSLAFCVTGSLLIAWLMDLVGISRFFFGRRALN
ncbi:MAG: acyltransferase [Bacteroidaceae bacterium]|nr:acyltransferase [Bacteroidaceae bacterium]